MKKSVFHKSIVLTLATAIIAVLSGCTDSNRSVDYPFYVSNSLMGSKADIVRVECSDSVTSVTMKYMSRPNFWFRWSENTVIYADGKAYPAIGSEGIVLGEKATVGDTGECEYTIYFEPIPRKTKSIDLSEGVAEGDFNFWGIDLTGKAKPKQNPQIPKLAKSDIMSGFDENIANSTIRVHLLGFHPSYPNNISLTVNQVISMSTMEAKADENGVAVFNFKQYGTAAFDCTMNYNILGQGSIAPGETLDIYYDLAGFGQKMMSEMRPDYVKPDIRYFGMSDGKYSCCACENIPISLNLFSDDFVTDFHIDADGYYDAIMARYNAMMAAVDTLQLSKVAKEITVIKAKQQLLYGMAASMMVLASKYFNQNGQAPDFPLAELEKRHYDKLFSEIDYTDPKLITYGKSGDFIITLGHLASTGKLAEGKLYEIGRTSTLAETAQNRKFNEEELNEINAMEWPFLRTVLLAVEEESDQIRKGAASSYLKVEDWPGAKAWMESIIAPHKGKVVMIDFWNTWCGPCRSAISHNEPYKNDELASDDIIWIYIADESSNLTKYTEMIGSIRGLHYMLTESQKKEVAKLLDIDGIPFYVLVERDGTYTPRPDLRNHSKFVKELKDRL